MSKATITLNNQNTELDLDNGKPFLYGKQLDTLTLQRAQYNGVLNIDSEEFVILPASGRSNAFNRPNKMELFKMGEKNENTIGKGIEHAAISGIMDSLFPIHGLFEYIKLAVEAFHHIDEGAGRKIDTTPKPININPRAAINPSLSFLPCSPFIIHDKPAPMLWNRMRRDVDEEKKKKRKKRSWFNV